MAFLNALTRFLQEILSVCWQLRVSIVWSREAHPFCPSPLEHFYMLGENDSFANEFSPLIAQVSPSEPAWKMEFFGEGRQYLTTGQPGNSRTLNSGCKKIPQSGDTVRDVEGESPP